MPTVDARILVLAAVACVLVVATMSGRMLSAMAQGEASLAFAENWQARVSAWWWMVGVGGVALLGGPWCVLVLFTVVSFLALREFLASTRFPAGAHGLVAMALYVSAPLQYVFVASGVGMLAVFGLPLLLSGALAWWRLREGHELATVLPVAGGVVVCVWGVSFSALPVMVSADDSGMLEMLFLVVVAQSCDVLQFLWGKALGRHPIAPTISPKKTVEGLVGGLLSAAALGAALSGLTPFAPAAAAAVAMAIGFTGFGGGLMLSAVKRQRGLKDWGTLLPGHGGMLDRADSLWLSAPVFVLLLAVWR